MIGSKEASSRSRRASPIPAPTVSAGRANAIARTVSWSSVSSDGERSLRTPGVCCLRRRSCQR